ncbi:MFS transporter [Clostridium swellfunianum]|uniref:MFS transporter n=1 Tax=Clostridium swellfunianum TaxID=1367462 RepID=UPI002030AB07|nr:MFS transporter [Clostridium swellfunianum]MCM0648301.1 MFS transporter [Clostridium swellfunianum]
MKLGALVEKVYFDSNPLHRKDYEKGRKFFIFECCFGVGVYSLTSGAFLAGLANYMGATDEFNGIVGAIPVFAGVIQIFSGLVFEKMERRKFLVSMLCISFRILLGLMFFIPLAFDSQNARLAALAGTYGVAYLLASFSTPPANNWLVSLTPEHIRGKYLAKRDAYSLAFLTAITLIVGKVLDIFKQAGNEKMGFVFMGFLVMAMAVLNFCSISSIKEPKMEVSRVQLKFRDIFLKPLRDSKFKLIIVLFILWNIGLQIAGPFFAVYMVTGIKLSYSYIMLMGVLSSIARIITVPYWGKLADHKSWITCTKYSLGMLGIIHACWLFVNNTTAPVLVPFLHVLSGIAWGGINMAMFNIQFLFSPKEGKTIYLGVNAALGGVLGFLSTIVGSMILGMLQGLNFNIGFITIGNMQIIFLMSGMLILATALYAHAFLKDNVPKKLAAAKVNC